MQNKKTIITLSTLVLLVLGYHFYDKYQDRISKVFAKDPAIYTQSDAEKIYAQGQKSFLEAMYNRYNKKDCISGNNLTECTKFSVVGADGKTATFYPDYIK